MWTIFGLDMRTPRTLEVANTFDSFDPLVFPDVPDSVVDSPPPSPPVTQHSEPEHSEL